MKQYTKEELKQLNEFFTSNFIEITLSMGIWRTKRSNKELSKEITAMKNAADGAVEAKTNIIAGFDTKYKEMATVQGSAGNWFRANTSPKGYDHNGKALPNRLSYAPDAVVTLIPELKKWVDEFKKAKKAFLDDYPTIRSAAISANASIATMEQFPDVAEVEEMCYMKFDIKPVQAIDTFSKLSIDPKYVQAFGDSMASSQLSVVDAVINNIIKQSVEYISTLRDTADRVLTSEKPRVFASSVDNLKPVLRLMKTSNVTNDQRIIDVVDDVEVLSLTDVKQLKNNVSVATKVRSLCDKVLAVLDSTYVAPKQVRTVAPVDTPPTLSPVDPVGTLTADDFDNDTYVAPAFTGNNNSF
jgi:hypothetical protein